MYWCVTLFCAENNQMCDLETKGRLIGIFKIMVQSVNHYYVLIYLWWYFLILCSVLITDSLYWYKTYTSNGDVSGFTFFKGNKTHFWQRNWVVHISECDKPGNLERTTLNFFYRSGGFGHDDTFNSSLKKIFLSINLAIYLPTWRDQKIVVKNFQIPPPPFPGPSVFQCKDHIELQQYLKCLNVCQFSKYFARNCPAAASGGVALSWQLKEWFLYFNLRVEDGIGGILNRKYFFQV